MPKYQKAAKPPVGRRIAEAVKNHAGATVGSIIAGVVVLVIGIVVFGQGGSDSDHSAAVAEEGNEPVAQTAPAPDNAVEEAATRPFWVLPPTTYEEAEEGNGGLASVDPVRPDLLVGYPKEVYQHPDRFVGLPFYLVGRIVSQAPLEDSFYGREILLDAGEPGYDVYVGATDYLTSVQDGMIVAVRGLLAAQGETERPGGDTVFRSIYLLATAEGNGGEVDSLILQPSSGTLKHAIERAAEKTK